MIRANKFAIPPHVDHAKMMRVSKLIPLRTCRLGGRRLLGVARAKPWRPHIDDVERLSKGDGAKIRGTGSREIPHRLNADERPLFETAKKKASVGEVCGEQLRRSCMCVIDITLGCTSRAVGDTPSRSGRPMPAFHVFMLGQTGGQAAKGSACMATTCRPAHLLL